MITMSRLPSMSLCSRLLFVTVIKYSNQTIWGGKESFGLQSGYNPPLKDV